MTEEIEAYDEELTEVITEIERGIKGLDRLRDVARLDRITELNQRVQRARQVLQSYKVEMRELPREEAAKYDLKAKQWHVHLQKLSEHLTWAKTEGDRSGLGLRDVNEMTSSDLVQEASRTQDQSLASLARMNKQLADTRGVANDTAASLRDQTEQLKNIDTDIMKVRSNLKRADLLLKAFMRRMMTDKIVAIMMCLIFCGVVGIIAYKIMDPQGSSENGVSVPDSVVDPMSTSTGSRRRRLLLGHL